MNVNTHTPSSSDDAQSVSDALASSARSDVTTPKQKFSWVATVLILVIVLCAAAAALWWQQQRFENAGRQVASRLQQIDIQTQATDQRAREALALAQSQSEKLEQIDAQVKVARSDFAAIEQSWRAFNHGVDDTLRANEIERLVLLANQQLSLTGQVAGSIAALEAAQQAIVRFDSPRFALVSQAIQSDLSLLRATPDVDMTGLTVKLDRLNTLIEQAPVLAPSADQAAKDTAPLTSPESGATSAKGASQNQLPAASTNSASQGSHPVNQNTEQSSFWSTDSLTKWWQQASEQASKLSDQAANVVTKEFSDIVRIRRAVDAQSLLMSEEQTITLRAHLRGLVLSAKLAMMMRQTPIWQSELSNILTLVDNRFDVSSPKTKSMIDLITQLKSTPIAVKLPTLVDSLNAVAAMRAKGFLPDPTGN